MLHSCWLKQTVCLITMLHMVRTWICLEHAAQHLWHHHDTSPYAQEYMQDNGTVLRSAYEVSCPALEEEPGLLPAFLAQMPGDNAEPGMHSFRLNCRLHVTECHLKTCCHMLLVGHSPYTLKASGATQVHCSSTCHLLRSDQLHVA